MRNTFIPEIIYYLSHGKVSFIKIVKKLSAFLLQYSPFVVFDLYYQIS